MYGSRNVTCCPIRDLEQIWNDHESRAPRRSSGCPAPTRGNVCGGVGAILRSGRPREPFADLQSRCRRDTIPIGLVAIDEREIMGTVAIDREPTTQLEPSIVGLLVRPGRRGEGIATGLLRAAAGLAKTIGYPRIHTSTALPYMRDALLSQGWRQTGEVKYLNGECGQVFELEF